MPGKENYCLKEVRERRSKPLKEAIGVSRIRLQIGIQAQIKAKTMTGEISYPNKAKAAFCRRHDDFLPCSQDRQQSAKKGRKQQPSPAPTRRAQRADRIRQESSTQVQYHQNPPSLDIAIVMIVGRSRFGSARRLFCCLLRMGLMTRQLCNMPDLPVGTNSQITDRM